uniref:LipRC1p n=1 Tax=Ricinus communis TaxID=3988 RepID=Q1W632_RICCO|nr:LipRC1p [Ricinus communis]
MDDAGKTTPTSHLIVCPDDGSFWDLFKHLVLGDMASGAKFLSGSDDKMPATATYYSRWSVSVLICKTLKLFETPLEILGRVTEFSLNFYYQNHGFLGILMNTLLIRLKIPKRGEADFISTIGYLDSRMDLHGTPLVSHQADEVISNADNPSLKEGHNSKIKGALGNRSLMDLCIMASKLAYENTKVVERVVTHHWKMQFVADYAGMNHFQGRRDTHAFIFCDKPKDANLIVISFRGTGPFSIRNWCTDFDFSLIEFGDAGNVHVGFLEAMGLGHRHVIPTFETSINTKAPAGMTQLRKESETAPEHFVWAYDGAYFLAVSKLKELLNEHKNAKFVVTGHSLGGALAILFTCILEIQQETEVLDRLLNVYTFGQPRIGNYNLGYFMQNRLNFPERRYFRVVYCNDMVPRVPFDDVFFTFEHFGTCIYYDSRFFGYFTKEEPSRNPFGIENAIRAHITAWWELWRSFILNHVYGAEYKETSESRMFRILGLFLPGVAAHSPVNYVNSVRLGRELAVPLMSLKMMAQGY